MNDSFQTYYQYLLQRSLLGSLYRDYFLYPRLSRHLSGRILDVGCGIGDFLVYSGADGVDINPMLIEHCRSLGATAHLMDSSGTLPFDDESYDSVLLDNVLEHLEDPRVLLLEIRRVLKPNGRLLIGVPGKRGYAIDPDHKTPYPETKLISTVEELGFRCVHKLATPLFRSEVLSDLLRIYCTYAKFERS